MIAALLAGDIAHTRRNLVALCTPAQPLTFLVSPFASGLGSNAGFGKVERAQPLFHDPGIVAGFLPATAALGAQAKIKATVVIGPSVSRRVLARCKRFGLLLDLLDTIARDDGDHQPTAMQAANVAVLVPPQLTAAFRASGQRHSRGTSDRTAPASAGRTSDICGDVASPLPHTSNALGVEFGYASILQPLIARAPTHDVATGHAVKMYPQIGPV